ncbi:hypothetical protein BDZ94DRAFT_1241375 [Collybia nuda]|uniref:Uncharacterized protein n=1 Tax=Collybia nuda TaxID=64659 RepID=A0A9P5XS13_9AGAR|nr:hypothetical protein BDZ94DRAFT_1241375 [Collybia nuda]
MKLSLVSTTLLGLVAYSNAVPLRIVEAPSTRQVQQLVSILYFAYEPGIDTLATRFYESEIEALIARTYGLIEELAEREWYEDLEVRTGDFANTNKRIKIKAYEFIDAALKKRAIQTAAQPSHRTGTYHHNAQFHLDRQQPTNAKGDHKIAVQLNKSGTSTIGQVVINNNQHVSEKTVADQLKHSVDIGAEVHARELRGPLPRAGIE